MQCNRLFIAARITTPLHQALKAKFLQLSQLGSILKVVDSHQLHITLKFLGPVPDKKVSPILEAVQRNSQAFDLSIRGIDAFPKPDRPRVIFARCSPQPILQIAEQIERELVDLGFAAETRPFQPHLTLARVKQVHPDLIKWIDANRRTEFGTYSIHGIQLINSIQPGLGNKNKYQHQVVEHWPPRYHQHQIRATISGLH